MKVRVISAQVCTISNRGSVTGDVTLDVTSFCTNVCSVAVFLHLCESRSHEFGSRRKRDSLCSRAEHGTWRCLMMYFWFKKKRKRTQEITNLHSDHEQMFVLNVWRQDQVMKMFWTCWWTSDVTSNLTLKLTQKARPSLVAYLNVHLCAFMCNVHYLFKLIYLGIARADEWWKTHKHPLRRSERQPCDLLSYSIRWLFERMHECLFTSVCVLLKA